MELLNKVKQSVSESHFPQAVETSLKPYLQHRCDNFTAGHIATCLPAWKNITADNEVLSTVMGMKIELDSSPIQHNLPPRKHSTIETVIIDSEIEKLLTKEVIERAKHCSDEVISDIFLRDKKDGTFRMILNLKKLNDFVTKHHFKMDTLTTIIRLVEKDCYMASIDLKDAYYSVPIAKAHRAYLRFIWRGTLYQFTCLPNGLSCAPRKFTKLLKPALSQLHLQGHLSSGYIDDIYLQSQTYNGCATNVIDTVTQFDALGLISHPSKSTFVPTQRLEILGFIMDSSKMTVTLTPAKAESLCELCKHLLAKPSPIIREVARVIGKIISTFPGVMYGPLHYRYLEYDKTAALNLNNWNFDKHMNLSKLAKAELTWWISHVKGSVNLITRDQPSHTLTTDASNEGWGAVVGNSSTGGLWSAHEKAHHINYLELLAVYLGLQSFYSNYRRTHIRLMIDNSTAVAVINHMGTSHSKQLNFLCTQVWEWCIARDIWVSAAHIAGSENVHADLESRANKSETEWMLNKDLLHAALQKLDFRPEIDLFASRINKQFAKYIAYRPDPGALAIDAFTVSWSQQKLYAFPPFSLIPLVLKKIIEDKANMICIIPQWPTQAWYPKAINMARERIVRLEPSASLLRLPNQPDKPHPLHNKLALLVCHLSGSN